jgi:hypothetical protein
MTDGWRDSTHERTDSHVLVAILILAACWSSRADAPPRVSRGHGLVLASRARAKLPASQNAPATLKTRLRACEVILPGPATALFARRMPTTHPSIGYRCHRIAIVRSQGSFLRLSGAIQPPSAGLTRDRANALLAWWRFRPSILRFRAPSLDDTLSTLDDLYETTLNPDGGFRSEQMEAIAKLAEKATGCLGE